YKVNRGDTLVGIAGRYAVTPRELIAWNHIGTKGITVGQTLRVTSDSAPGAAKSRRASGAGGRLAVATKLHHKSCCASGKAQSRPVSSARGITRSTKMTVAHN